MFPPADPAVCPKKFLEQAQEFAALNAAPRIKVILFPAKKSRIMPGARDFFPKKPSGQKAAVTARTGLVQNGSKYKTSPQSSRLCGQTLIMGDAVGYGHTLLRRRRVRYAAPRVLSFHNDNPQISPIPLKMGQIDPKTASFRPLV
jgi:hypothetical protein